LGLALEERPHLTLIPGRPVTERPHYGGTLDPGFLGKLAQGTRLWRLRWLQSALDQLVSGRRVREAQDLQALAAFPQDDWTDLVRFKGHEVQDVLDQGERLS
jgi:hypothetical protein